MEDVLQHLSRVACEHSHPYIETYYPETWVNRFKIGYLPKGVFPFKKYDSEMLSQMGIYYRESDFSPFENRIIIPIYDGSTLVAIAGRYPSKEVPKGEKKYINSIFTKDKFFYTIPCMKPIKGEAKGLFLNEGYTDVMALSDLHQTEKWNGIYPIALMGLSFSDVRIERINRMGLPVFFCLDGDKAGLDTLYRIRHQVSKLTVPVKVIALNLGDKGIDPDEFMDLFGDLPDPISFGNFLISYMKNNEYSLKDIVDEIIQLNMDDELISYFG